MRLNRVLSYQQESSLMMQSSVRTFAVAFVLCLSTCSEGRSSRAAGKARDKRDGKHVATCTSIVKLQGILTFFVERCAFSLGVRKWGHHLRRAGPWNVHQSGRNSGQVHSALRVQTYSAVTGTSKSCCSRLPSPVNLRIRSI